MHDKIVSLLNDRTGLVVHDPLYQSVTKPWFDDLDFVYEEDTRTKLISPQDLSGHKVRVEKVLRPNDNNIVLLSDDAQLESIYVSFCENPDYYTHKEFVVVGFNSFNKSKLKAFYKFVMNFKEYLPSSLPINHDFFKGDTCYITLDFGAGVKEVSTTHDYSLFFVRNRGYNQSQFLSYLENKKVPFIQKYFFSLLDRYDFLNNLFEMFVTEKHELQPLL